MRKCSSFSVGCGGPSNPANVSICLSSQGTSQQVIANTFYGSALLCVGLPHTQSYFGLIMLDLMQAGGFRLWRRQWRWNAYWRAGCVGNCSTHF
jgi:hypothetical protein